MSDDASTPSSTVLDAGPCPVTLTSSINVIPNTQVKITLEFLLLPVMPTQVTCYAGDAGLYTGDTDSESDVGLYAGDAT